MVAYCVWVVEDGDEFVLVLVVLDEYLLDFVLEQFLVQSLNLPEIFADHGGVHCLSEQHCHHCACSLPEVVKVAGVKHLELLYDA